MKRAILLAVMIVLGVTSAVSAAGVKIGVVDLNTILTESEAGKRANAELAALVAERQTAAQQKQQTVEALRKELEQLSGAAPEEKQAKQGQLDQAAAEYQKQVADANAEIQKRADEARTRLLQEIGEVMAKLTQEGDYSVILEARTVYFYAPVVDITWEVIRRCNDVVGK